MPFIAYPGSNFHDLDLDWLLREMKNCLEEWTATKGEWDETKEDWTELQAYVENYFNTLDVSQEISDKIDALIDSGDFLDIIKTTVQTQTAATTTAWLESNIVQETGYVIDKTLTVEDAAADAETVGFKFAVQNQTDFFLNNYNLITELKHTDQTNHGITWHWTGNIIGASGTATELAQYTIYNDESALPDGFVPGKKIFVTHSNADIELQIWGYQSGSPVSLWRGYSNGEFTYPADGNTLGLIIRLSIASGQTPHVSSYVGLSYAKSADKVQTLVDENYFNTEKSLAALPINQTINLFDYSTVTSGYILNKNVPVAATNYFYSDYIKIDGLPICYRDQGASIASIMNCYDENKNYIGAIDYSFGLPYYERITNDGTYLTNYYKLIPRPGTVYVRMNGRYNSNLMLTPLFYPHSFVGYGDIYTKPDTKIAMFGDSITLGTNGNTSETTPYNLPYWVERTTNYAVTNYGVGSMGWVSTAYMNQIAYDKISSTDISGFDVVTLCYGVNDSAATMGTWDSSDETTIMGQVNKCIKYIGATNPNARIILIAPWNGRAYGTFPEWRYGVRTSGGFTRQELSEAMQECAEYYHIGFISQMDSPLNGFGLGTVSNQKTGPFCGSDDVHPSLAGYKAMGYWLGAKLKSIIE